MKVFNPQILVSFLLVLFVACQQNHQSTSTVNSPEESALFEFIPSSHSGIQFNNKIEENFKNFFAKFNYVYNGGGVAIGDINQDGLADLYFTGNDVANELYLNKGDLQFEDITKKAKVVGAGGWHNGVVMADVNNDGWLDIYVCRGGWESPKSERTNLLFINNQDLSFTESANEYGLDDEGYSLQASFFDMDNDGDLDMYLTNRPERFFLDYQKVLEGKEKGDDLYRDKLYQNNNGKYIEVGLKAGIDQNFGYGLGLVTSDFNKDGYTDIYVANDYLESDYLYINQGNGTFKEKIKEYTRHVPFYAMGVDAVDMNNDGWEDLITLEMLPADYVRSKTTMASMNPQLFDNLVSNGFQHQYMHNMLQLNRGRTSGKDLFFSEIGQMAGIAKTDWSWACLGSDFDNDGWRDIFISNGFRRDIWDKDANAKFRAFMQSPQRKNQSNEENAKYITNLFAANEIENYVFKNNGDLSFSDQSKNWGLTQKSFSNGAAVGDLDNDGDLDLVVNNIAGEAFLYQNKAEKNGNHYLKIKLEGSAKNVHGLGAKLTIRYDGNMQYHEFKNVRGYLSSVEPLIHFGLGTYEKIDEVEIIWPDQKKQILKDVVSNQTLSINYKNAQSENARAEAPSPSLFEEVSPTYFKEAFVHRENDYDDYRDQILLPHKLSKTGPCLAVADANQDGLEDFFVGGAKGQAGAVYMQTNDESFYKKTNADFEKDAPHEDVGATFFDADGDGDMDLYVSSGGNELTRNLPFYQDRLYLNEKGSFVKSDGLPAMFSSGSCVVPHDWDEDGDLDLFVGARVTPARYPSPPQSYLLENEDGKFKNVTKQIAPQLSNVGMVTAAVWQDMDGDQIKELVVVGEWMPISIFRKGNNQWDNVTDEYGFRKTSGWWNTITACDYDGDGDEDLMIGNLGLNYKFQATAEKPFVVFAKDFDRNGTNDIFLAKYHKEELVPVRGKECSAQQIPKLNQKFATYRQFAESNIHEILEGQTDQALKYEAHTFASSLLENRNGQWKLQVLPTMAQLSAVNGIIVADFNGDKKMDFLVAGNKYESEIETTRADASLGIVFTQEVPSSFDVVPPHISGFSVPEDVKALQEIRLGKQKKLGILVGINDGKLRLFQLINDQGESIQ